MESLRCCKLTTAKARAQQNISALHRPDRDGEFQPAFFVGRRITDLSKDSTHKTSVFPFQPEREHYLYKNRFLLRIELRVSAENDFFHFAGCLLALSFNHLPAHDAGQKDP